MYINEQYCTDMQACGLLTRSVAGDNILIGIGCSWHISIYQHCLQWPMTTVNGEYLPIFFAQSKPTQIQQRETRC